MQVNDYSGMANNPNIKFRSFICQGLNDGLLHEWISVLTSDEATMAKFYEAWAYVRASEVSANQCCPPHPHPDFRSPPVAAVQGAPSMVMTTLEPLKALPFHLSLDYEITRWDL